MSIESACIAALRRHVLTAGLQCEVVNEEDRLKVPRIACEISATGGARHETFVSVTIETRAAEAREGIAFVAVGLGSDQEIATADAAAQWANGVLPVLRSFAEHSHVCGVAKVPTIVEFADSGERFGWTVYLGPVLGRAAGEHAEKLDQREFLRDDTYGPLFPVLQLCAAHKGIMWVDAYVGRFFNEEKANATCRLNNRDIEEGVQALLEWARTWPALGATFLSKRQFMLLEPTPLDALPEDLLRSLEREVEKRRVRE
jgi:hypothetical protein